MFNFQIVGETRSPQDFTQWSDMIRSGYNGDERWRSHGVVEGQDGYMCYCPLIPL